MESVYLTLFSDILHVIFRYSAVAYIPNYQCVPIVPIAGWMAGSTSPRFRVKRPNDRKNRQPSLNVQYALIFCIRDVQRKP